MNTRKSARSAVALSLCALAHGPAARANDTLDGANIVALGGTSVANVEDNATIASNPAMLAMTPRYDLAGTFFLQVDGDLGWNLNAMDSSRSNVAFGAGWSRTVVDPPLTDAELPGWTAPGVVPTNRRKTSVFTAGFSVAPGERRVSWGLGGSIGTVSHDRLGKKLTGDLSTGFGLRAGESGAFGLVVNGLLPVKGPQRIPLNARLGARYALDEGPSVAMDVGWQFQDDNGLGLVGSVGAEAAVGIVRPRLGYSYDGPTRQSTLTGGVGGENKSGGLDFGVAVPLGPGFTGKHIRGVLTIRLRT